MLICALCVVPIVFEYIKHRRQRAGLDPQEAILVEVQHQVSTG